jgi:hypothetical protein
VLRDAARRLIDNTSGDKQRSERQRIYTQGLCRRRHATGNGLRASLGLRNRAGRGRPSKGKISQPSEKFDRDKIYT